MFVNLPCCKSGPRRAQNYRYVQNQIEDGNPRVHKLVFVKRKILVMRNQRTSSLYISKATPA